MTGWPKWLPGWVVAIVAALVGVFALGRKSRSTNQPADGAATINRAREVSDEQAAAVENAGRELADNLASSPAAKRAGILKWARERGAKKRSGGGAD